MGSTYKSSRDESALSWSQSDRVRPPHPGRMYGLLPRSDDYPFGTYGIELEPHGTFHSLTWYRGCNTAWLPDTEENFSENSKKYSAIACILLKPLKQLVVPLLYYRRCKSRIKISISIHGDSNG